MNLKFATFLGALIVAGLALASAQPSGDVPHAVPRTIPAAPSEGPSQVEVPRTVHLAPAAPGFEAYKQHLMHRARATGVREATIQSYVPGLKLNDRAIELDRAQAPAGASSIRASPLTPYLQRHLTSSLISRGQARYHSHWRHLVQIQTRYGVDPAVLMAIYGKETSYGSVTGSFDLLDVLASLAYDGRRRSLFEAEFVSALKLLDSGFTKAHLRGSYAGATGFPQFMPSVVLRLRADGDGDGQADIWRSEPDALASIANYLRDAGWKPAVPWGAEVRLPVGFDRTAVRLTAEPTRCPAVFRRHSRLMPVSEWRRLGVMVVSANLPDGELASLLELDGPGGPAYLLTENYRAILSYNCSNAYAMSIGLLANAIARR